MHKLVHTLIFYTAKFIYSIYSYSFGDGVVNLFSLWLDGVMPMVMDKETSVQEKCFSLLEEFLLSQITSHTRYAHMYTNIHTYVRTYVCMCQILYTMHICTTAYGNG